MPTDTEQLRWQDRAACAGMPLSVFFPPPGARTEAAQRACSRCPVVGPCAEYGERQSHGVWGGQVRSANVARDDAEEDRTEAANTPVPEALQPAPSQPYSCQRTATTTTTTTPTEAPAMSKNTTTESPAATTDETRAKSAVSKDGDHKCPSCKTTKPVTKYPTVRNAQGEYVRSLDECRPCRDERRAARKAEREAAKATAA